MTDTISREEARELASVLSHSMMVLREIVAHRVITETDPLNAKGHYKIIAEADDRASKLLAKLSQPQAGAVPQG